MQISKIGEFGLIERFRRFIKTDKTVAVASGDDCAAIKYTANKYLLYTCDMIIEGVDFLPKDNPALIGRKALAVSISDIAACGGIPRYCVVALGLPKNFSVAKAEKLASGLFKLAKEFKVNVVGGDISRSDRLVIDVSMLGVVEKKNLVLRSGARAGDIIFVSGRLGGSIRGKHLDFSPRVRESRYLVNNFRINSMCDISDGLIQDLGHILDNSSTGAVLYEELIPLSRAAVNLDDALYGGEDFELLFTLSRKEALRLRAGKPYDFYPIGSIMPKKFGLKLIDAKGREKRLKARRGFRHF